MHKYTVSASSTAKGLDATVQSRASLLYLNETVPGHKLLRFS